MKRFRQKIVMLTCYDFSMAKLLNEAGVDVLLVGDSLGMVKLGYPNTLPVTVEDMLYHTRIVARGNTRALLVADMPYLSYQGNPEEAVQNCGRMLKEGGAAAVKLEGGAEIVPALRALAVAKIPVMGHVGMTPQSIHALGGYKVQGKTPRAARRIFEDAVAITRAGVFSVVLECVPAALARKITARLPVPTIGIGAGLDCDGQVLVIDDLLGLYGDKTPKFVKRYANLRKTVVEAAAHFAQEVRQKRYPGPEHTYG